MKGDDMDRMSDEEFERLNKPGTFWCLTEKMAISIDWQCAREAEKMSEANFVYSREINKGLELRCVELEKENAELKPFCCPGCGVQMFEGHIHGCNATGANA